MHVNPATQPGYAGIQTNREEIFPCYRLTGPELSRDSFSSKIIHQFTSYNDKSTSYNDDFISYNDKRTTYNVKTDGIYVKTNIKVEKLENII